jgi:hypothetical protein
MAASAPRSMTGSVSPSRYEVGAAKYASVSWSNPAETGMVEPRVSPDSRSIMCSSARPVRPLPSVNGWMVSNWACASARWTNSAEAPSARDVHVDDPGTVTTLPFSV